MTIDQQTAPITRRQRRRLHGSVYIGLTLLCMVVGFIVFSALTTWWQHTDDYLHYGMPRTFQMDAVVGHQDSAAHPSHFLALNLDGQLTMGSEYPSYTTYRRLYEVEKPRQLLEGFFSITHGS